MLKELKQAVEQASHAGHEGEHADGRPWRTEELKAAIKVQAELVAYEERKKVLGRGALERRLPASRLVSRPIPSPTCSMSSSLFDDPCDNKAWGLHIVGAEE